MPWPWIRNMTDDDLKAIFAYLRSIPPVRNKVPDPLPPAEAPAEQERLPALPAKQVAPGDVRSARIPPASRPVIPGAAGGTAMRNVPACDLLPVALVALATAVPASGSSPPSSEAAALDRDCQAGRAAACDALARMHVEGRGVPRDVARGLQLHEKACEAGHLESCRSAGVLLERTPGITPDQARARSLFERACDGGNAAGCGNLAVQAESQDKDRALALYVRACDMGNVLACTNGAHFLTWAKSDPSQRRQLLDKGCAFGGGSMAAMACRTLAREHETGASAEDAAEAARLRERSVRLLQEACDGNGWECRGLAAMYESGDGVPRDPQKAALLWKRYAAEVQRTAEHDPNPWFLGELAQLYADGKGVPRDAGRAQALRVKAADTTRGLCVVSGDADSCFSLARMYEKGEGVDASAAQAIALYARACQAKHEVACGEEKRLKAPPQD